MSTIETIRDVMPCSLCLYREQTTLFELCKHESSYYTAGGNKDYHTVGHMRTRGVCGHEGRNFQLKGDLRDKVA